ncbi:unnamed protein product [Didymodactylos carnosus]|uniref:Metallo-beta-lactamase domain-containing protein n=1 Tax=Didymodactylos carnosus TaxID=1234261 RepID=A0A814GEC6_9BILA|nr:unnamed protein product [Didymodactylos carnosus]CAF1204198.1 unnamed protein product [Didymodactylos carnosus]CAF3766894.1 unnamed protein product [Didymodactylos carnosus]CAF4013849.1 unnamed protein product [Didymodactylos carnosus]
MATSEIKKQLIEIGPGFWNIRGHFKKLAGLVDIETQMSIIRLKNGNFIIIDTIPIDQGLKIEIDELTSYGDRIEAVLATHPFHTLAFPAFYQLYPKPPYYGTPRHLRKLTDIKWFGNLIDLQIREKWEPDIEMRIPAGAEFIAPEPEKSNHFVSVFVYHGPSHTLHVDDTIMYSPNPSFLLKVAGYKHGSMIFQPAIKNHGLYPTADAPYHFRDWMRKILNDWNFDNICCAHMGIKIGGAKQQVQDMLNKAEPLFQKLSEKNQKHNPQGDLKVKQKHDDKEEQHDGMNISGNECG